jgi:orotate phosphoribosyltransferase
MAVDRSGGLVKFGLPMFNLIAINVAVFEPDKLPPALAAIPTTKPGSK